MLTSWSTPLRHLHQLTTARSIIIIILLLQSTTALMVITAITARATTTATPHDQSQVTATLQYALTMAVIALQWVLHAQVVLTAMSLQEVVIIDK